jgi:hypothetical protein
MMQLDCQKIKELFSPYLDGELDAHDGDRLREHLANCPECRLELEAWRNISVNLRDLSSATFTAPPGFTAQVMNRVQTEQREKPFYQTRRSFKVAAGIAAALVLAVAAYFITPEQTQMAHVNPPITDENTVEPTWSDPIPEDSTDNLDSAALDVEDTPPVDANPVINANNANNSPSTATTVDEPGESIAPPVNNQPSAELTPPPENTATAYVLTSNTVVSSLLVIKADAVDVAEDKAREAASKLNASFVSIGKENNGETARSSYKITISSAQADKLITQFSALGEVVSYQSEEHDLSDKYTESRAHWLSLQNQRRETTDSDGLKQLDAQIKVLDDQLKEWNQQAQKQTIVLWLQNY